MPRGPKLRLPYSVHVTRYATMETKEHVERGEIYISRVDQLDGRLAYLGTDEHAAAQRFYRACKEGMQDPLAISVEVSRGNQTIIRVRLRSGLGYN